MGNPKSEKSIKREEISGQHYNALEKYSADSIKIPDIQKINLQEF